jgi:hypothetical protein
MLGNVYCEVRILVAQILCDSYLVRQIASEHSQGERQEHLSSRGALACEPSGRLAVPEDRPGLACSLSSRYEQSAGSTITRIVSCIAGTVLSARF